MTSIVTLLLGLLVSQLAFSQQSGSVRFGDQPVPGAIVTATQGTRQTVATTEDDGNYLIPGLEPGEWQIRVEMYGFQTQEKLVQVGGNPVALTWNLELQSRTQRQATSSAGAPSAPREQQIQISEDDSSAPAPGAGGNVNESFLINGSVSQGLGGGSQSMSMRRWGSGDGRTFGNRRNRGGFRGSILWNLRNSALDARPYSITGQRVSKPDYAQNRVSLTLGGPLRIPKLVTDRRHTFSFSYGLNRGQYLYNTFATLPTALERAGDFSQSVARFPVVIFDPLTGLPFAGNRLPPNRIRPASTGLLHFIPLPNQPGQVQNYQLVTHVPRHSHSVRGSVDLRLSAKDRLSISPDFQQNDSEQSQIFGYRDRFEGSSFSSNVTWTRTFTGNTTMSLWGGYARNRQETVPFFAFKGNVAAQLGILGTSQDPANYGPPNLDFTNFGALRDASPQVRRDLSSSLGSGLYHSRGQHYFSSTFNLYQSRVNNRTDEDGRGTYSFSGLATSGFDGQGFPLPNSGFDFADFMLGLPQSASVRFGASDNRFRSTSYSFAFTDDWRVRENLSFSLGAQYEYAQPYTESNGRMANLDFAPYFTAAAVVTPGQTGPFTGRFPSSLIDSDRNNFSPRLGFAWRPFLKGSLSLRGGYGIYYNGAVYDRAALRLASQPPFAQTGILTTSTANPLRIETGFVNVSANPNDQIRNTYAVSRAYRIGYAQIWHFAASKELPRSLFVEAGYLGTKGTRLDIQRLPNRAAPGSPLTSEERRLIDNAVGFTFDSSDGNSILHAGQLRFVRRFQKGMSLNAFYTFAKSIDNASTFGGGGGVVAQDDRNLRAERGLSSFDERHTLNLSYLVLSPVGDQGAPLQFRGPAGAALRNWVFLGGVSARSGGWLTARVLGNLSDSGGTGSVGSGRADSTGAPVGGGSGFFNLAAFAIPAPTRFGNAGRNTIPTPSVLVLNLSVTRTFSLDDRRTLEFRMDSNNFGNFVNISRFGTTVNASNYGVAIAAGGMRTSSISVRFRF